MFKIFCCCNAVISDLYDSKSKNKIGVTFFFLIPMAVCCMWWKKYNFNIFLHCSFYDTVSDVQPMAINY